MSHSAHTPETDSPPDRKSVLFCPACGHESPVGGDWVVRDRATSVEYRCPDCDERITRRERENNRKRSPLTRSWSAWIHAATAWLRPPRRLMDG